MNCRYQTCYPSYSPATAPTTFYSSDLTPFSVQRGTSGVRTEFGLPKDVDIKSEIVDAKEHGKHKTNSALSFIILRSV